MTAHSIAGSGKKTFKMDKAWSDCLMAHSSKVSMSMESKRVLAPSSGSMATATMASSSPITPKERERTDG